MSENTPPKPSRIRALVILVAGAMILAATAVVSTTQTRPIATFTFGEDRLEVQPFDAVPMYDAMTLRVDLPFPGYVYVVAFDYERGAVCYYPTDFLGTDHAGADGRMNFFAAGKHELPGTWDGKPQAWYVPDAKEVLSLCVVVSKQALTDLEAALILTRQVGNRAFPTRTMGMYMPRAGRAKVIGKRAMPHAILKAAMNQEDSVIGGPMVACRNHSDVFVTCLNIQRSPPRPGAKPPSNPLSGHLEKLKPKMNLKTK